MSSLKEHFGKIHLGYTLILKLKKYRKVVSTFASNSRKSVNVVLIIRNYSFKVCAFIH